MSAAPRVAWIRAAEGRGMSVEPARPAPEASVRVLLAATAWSAALVVLSVVLPVYTVPNGQAGPQPRQTLVEHFGWRAIVPAVGLLAATIVK